MDELRIEDRIRQEPVLAALRRPQNWRCSDRQERLKQFRDKAEELRAIAEDVILADTRQMLLHLAQTYEQMAISLERVTLA